MISQSFNPDTFKDISNVETEKSVLIFSVRSLDVVSMHTWVLSGHCGFFPQSKNMHVKLIDQSKLI